MKNMKFFILLAGLFTSAIGDSILSIGPKDDRSNIENFMFENEIKEFLEKLRGILKNGDPENGIPVLEPLPIPHYDFDFILEDSRLKGYIGDLLVHNISDFNVINVKFNLLLFRLELSLSFNVLTIDGGIKLLGNIFEENINTEGTFLSNTTNLNLDLVVHLASNLNRTLIHDLTLSFAFDKDDIVYKNTVTGEMSGHMDNSYLQPLLYRIQDEYFPLLLNTLKLVGSDLIYAITLDEILKYILGIILGGGFELIATKH